MKWMSIILFYEQGKQFFLTKEHVMASGKSWQLLVETENVLAQQCTQLSLFVRDDFHLILLRICDEQASKICSTFFSSAIFWLCRMKGKTHWNKFAIYLISRNACSNDEMSFLSDGQLCHQFHFCQRSWRNKTGLVAVFSVINR
jgi:hypothetical protein